MKIKPAQNKKRLATKKGSALILTMFILTGMFVVAMGSSYIILVQIRAGGIQSQSTKAYFLAESGAERLLYATRKQYYQLQSQAPDTELVALRGTNYNYSVYYKSFPPLVFSAIGEYNNTRRSVELEFRGN